MNYQLPAVGMILIAFAAKSDGDDSLSAAIEIVDNYQEWVEYHRGAFVIQESNCRSREKTVQRTIHAVALVFCKKFIGILALRLIAIETL